MMQKVFVEFESCAGAGWYGRLAGGVGAHGREVKTRSFNELMTIIREFAEKACPDGLELDPPPAPPPAREREVKPLPKPVSKGTRRTRARWGEATQVMSGNG